MKRLQDIEPPEFRLRVGDYRLRFHDQATPSTSLPSSTAAKPTANLEHSSGDTAHLGLATVAVPFVLACVFKHMRRRHSSHS